MTVGGVMVTRTAGDTGGYSQLFHLLCAHRHTASLLGDKPAQRQGSVVKEIKVVKKTAMAQ